MPTWADICQKYLDPNLAIPTWAPASSGKSKGTDLKGRGLVMKGKGDDKGKGKDKRYGQGKGKNQGQSAGFDLDLEFMDVSDGGTSDEAYGVGSKGEERAAWDLEHARAAGKAMRRRELGQGNAAAEERAAWDLEHARAAGSAMGRRQLAWDLEHARTYDRPTAAIRLLLSERECFTTRSTSAPSRMLQ